MQTFNLIKTRKIDTWYYDYYEIEAESIDEAKDKLLKAVETGEEYEDYNGFKYSEIQDDLTADISLEENQGYATQTIEWDKTNGLSIWNGQEEIWTNEDDDMIRRYEASNTHLLNLNLQIEALTKELKIAKEQLTLASGHIDGLIQEKEDLNKKVTELNTQAEEKERDKVLRLEYFGENTIPEDLTWEKLFASTKCNDPKIWLQMYFDYHDMLEAQDVANWWAEQFICADKERNELKVQLEVFKEESTRIAKEEAKKIAEDLTRNLNIKV
jgi:hypothetical protein